MLQSGVTLLLIPCLLLNQSAALAHSHGNVTDEAHGVRAHFHLGLKSSASGHGVKHHSRHGHSLHEHSHHEHSHHEHSHHGHSHHGYSHRHSHADKHKDKPKETHDGCCSPPLQHDDDCVYVASVDAAGLDRTSREDLQFDALPACVLTRWNSPDLHLRTHEKWSDRPPPLLFGSCPLYLRNLSLLI